MTDYDIYVFLLCLIVFLLLTSLSITVITIIVKQLIKLITLGAEDEKIIKEYNKNRNRKKWKKICEKTFTGFLCAVFVIFFSCAFYLNVSQNSYHEDVPNFKVVQTASMAKKHPKNVYLYTNNLNNQIDTFDLIFVYKLPSEDSLKLYDVVVYEVDGILLVHRIVKIEERNATHPEERWFMCQGDAVESPDRFPVKYSQMRGIYRGENVPFIGSFIMFMQSPAGWLCLLLIIVAIISLPIIEKKLEKVKYDRLTAIGFFAQLAITEAEQNVSVFDKFNKDYTRLSFTELLDRAPSVMRERYDSIVEFVSRIDGVRLISSFKNRTFKKGNTPIIRFAMRGKTLNAYLGLNAIDYANSKYIFTDVSSVKKYANYPMRVKVTSDRQARWVNELILELVKKENLVLLDKPVLVKEQTEKLDFTHLKGKVNNKTFVEKLAMYPVANDRYTTLCDKLDLIVGARIINAKNSLTYKRGSVPLVRFTMRGKTLNAYFGLDPKEFANSKYIFTDVSSVKKYENYAMRFKLSSDRQTRWALEIIDIIVNKHGFIYGKKKIDLTHLKGKKDNRSFAERLNSAPEKANGFYSVIESKIAELENCRVIDGKTRTFKVRNVPLMRFAIRGKTLNAYIGLNPNEYKDTKYIFTDVSSVKKYANYPMRVKVTSDRQARWTNELLEDIVKKNSLKVKQPILVAEQAVSPFEHLKGKKNSLTFKKKLKKYAIAKERFNSILETLLSVDGVRSIESVGGITYKKGNTPIVRFTIRGKTLNAYLGLNPSDYANSKYIFTDVSNVKKYANYPMRVKVTSDRQVRWTKELIVLILKGVGV